MNTRAMLMGLCLVLLGAAAHAGEIPANTKGIWFCQTVSQAPTATVYVSDVFAGDFVGTEVRTAFGKMLAEKHNVTNGVSCSTAYAVTTLAMAASNQSRGYTPYDWKE